MLKILRGIVKIAGVVVTVGGLLLTALGERQNDTPPTA